MANLSATEWSQISDIIIDINMKSDEETILHSFFEKLKEIIYFDHGAFFPGYNDGNSRFLAEPITYNQEVATQSTLSEYEKYRDVDYIKWMYALPDSTVYRETDYLKNSIRENTDMFKKIYQPMGLYYCAGINMVYNRVFLGNASIFRYKKNGNFTKKDMYVLEFVQPHLTYRIYQIHPQGKNQQSMRCAIGDEYNLTQRELDIIGLVCKGLSNSEIGSQLFISEDTVKKHIYHIYKKMNISSRSKLISILTEKNYKISVW